MLKIVKAPILPKNIKKHNIILLGARSIGVRLSESPVVPNADMVSKTIAIKPTSFGLNCSINAIIALNIKIDKTAIVVRVNAFILVSLLIFLLKAVEVFPTEKP